MILCKDCKHCDLERVWCEKHRDYLNSTDEISCIHAERAGGLTVCCRDCKYAKDIDNPFTDIAYCQKGHWGTDSGINHDKMSCPEWVPREVITAYENPPK